MKTPANLNLLSLGELIGEYWSIAYNEGVEGREHDTPGSDAQRVWNAINDRLDVLEKDAARYRKLMSVAIPMRVTSGEVLAFPPIRTYESIHGPDLRDNLDAAVDLDLEKLTKLQKT